MRPLKIRSIKLNIVLNNIRLLLNLMIPLIIFPYVSRILEPAGLGKVEYAYSIIWYFELFAALGIPIYGVREIARMRDDLLERSKVVWELTLLSAVTVGIGYIAYFIFIRFVPFMDADKTVFYVIAPAIFLSCFSYEWFYTGIEDQLYITLRFVLIKILQVILVFLCIKNRDDFAVYAGITIWLNGITVLFNVSGLKKYIQFVPFPQLNIKRHLKSVLWIFVSLVAISIYAHLDITMIGIMVGDTAVGLYTVANKVVRIIISLVTSFGAVMIPRIENCLKNGDKKGYREYLDKSMRTILIIGVPACFGLIIVAPEMILLFAGDKYMESVLSIRLLAPIIVIVGLANFVGIQVLYVNRQEKKYTIAVSIAATANVAFNFFMIPVLKQNGAIVGTLLAEVIGLGIQIGFARKLLKETELFTFNTLKYFAAAIVMTIVVYFVQIRIEHFVFSIFLYAGLGGIIYALLLICLREKTIRQIALKYQSKKLKG